MRNLILKIAFILPQVAFAQQLKHAEMDMAPGCRIGIQITFDAQVSSGRANGGSGSVTVKYPPRGKKLDYEDPFHLGFMCFDADDKYVHHGAARWDMKKGHWVRDFENRVSGSNDVGLTPKERRQLDRAIHFYELKSVNAIGYAYTEDATYGEEAYRTRHLVFCLIHEAKAVCGEDDMGYLEDIRRNKKNDLTPYALQILKSIEFLPDANQPVTTGNATSAVPK